MTPFMHDVLETIHYNVMYLFPTLTQGYGKDSLGPIVLSKRLQSGACLS